MSPMRVDTLNTLRWRVAYLHKLLGERLLSPMDPTLPERIDAAADLCWESGLAGGRSPHLCQDRYCDCHLVLFEREPPSLFGERKGW